MRRSGAPTGDHVAGRDVPPQAGRGADMVVPRWYALPASPLDSKGDRAVFVGDLLQVIRSRNHQAVSAACAPGAGGPPTVPSRLWTPAPDSVPSSTSRSCDRAVMPSLGNTR